MRTDFKEEKKWKIANAFMMSKAIMEWHHAADKSTVCVKVSIGKKNANIIEGLINNNHKKIDTRTNYFKRG